MSRAWWGWTIALGGLGALLCALPLFNLLGYEFSFALALAVSFAGAHLGAAGVAAARQRRTRSESERDDAHPAAALARLCVDTTLRLWVALLAPLGVITLNALRVRNCDWWGGLAWFAVLPLASAALASACGVLAGVTLRRGAVAAALAFIVASLAWSLWRFYAAPPIDAYNPFAGYFPGTLYDEEVAIAAPLEWARAWQAAAALAALAALAPFLDGTTLSLRRRALRGRGGLLFVALSCLALAAALGANGARLGFRRDAADIAAALGAERHTTHFVLHYSPSGPFAKEIDRVAADHELRYTQLTERLGVEPRTPVHSFLFDSPSHKRSLVGAQHTSVAKPWRREIYLQYEPWPHPTLEHELAHVFAGAFGDHLFGVSRRGLAFNVGLIEGVAVAASFHGAPLTPDQLVQVMRSEGIEPRLTDVLSVRFLGLNGSRAYALAGSFCHFLLTRYGAARLRAVFFAGGDDAAFRAAYGQPLDALGAEWSRQIDALAVDPQEAAVAHERLRQPSVFHKACAHELALRREAARRATSDGDRTRALALLAAVCRDEPGDTDAVVEWMQAARAAGQNDQALRLADELLAHPKASAPVRARALALRGDVALERGDRAAAGAAYLAAEALPLDESNARLVTVKRLIAESAAPDTELVRFLAGAGVHDAVADVLTTHALAAAHPRDGLLLYLYGRQLESRGRYADAADALERAAVLGLPDARFVREARRLAGISRFREGQLTAARADFSALAADAPDGLRLEAADWLRRCDFAAATAPGLPAGATQ